MFLKRSLAIFLIKFLSEVIAFPERTEFNSPDVNGLLTALRRSDPAYDRPIYTKELNCPVDMVGISGEYYYTSNGNEDICMVYFLAEEDEVLEIEFIEANYNCDEIAAVQWYDGWSMGVGSFPSIDDHPLNVTERLQDVCPGNERRLIYRAHQNAAMMAFKLNTKGSSIRIALRLIRIPEPCNVMANNPSGLFTIRNYGAERNCSFSVIYPTRISVVQMNIGHEQSEATLRCRNANDFVEFLAGNDLDSSSMRQDAVLCGISGHAGPVSNVLSRSVVESADSTEIPHQSSSLNNEPTFECPTCSPGIHIDLNCQNSVVRLVSEAGQDNSVTIDYRQTMNDKNDCAVPEL